MKPTALFVTCLVDQFFPRVGEAAVTLLEQAGSQVDFPGEQTCCGQPLFNTGHREPARDLARRFIEIFEPYESVVTPSGSCASMVRRGFQDLFEKEPDWQERARSLGERTFELTEFLDRAQFRPRASYEGNVAYHPSCHLLRELGVDEAPQRLLWLVRGLNLIELDDGARCCGFGGAFSVKFPGLSTSMLEDKIAAIDRSGSTLVTSADVGCLMHLRGGLTRRESDVRVVHVAELLAGSIGS